MKTRTNIFFCTSIIYLLFVMKLTEPIHLYRRQMMMGRKVKCCNVNNGNQTVVNQRMGPYDVPEYRREMTEPYVGLGTDNRAQGHGLDNMAAPALAPETDVAGRKSNEVPPFEELADHLMSPEEQKAVVCAKLPCQPEDHEGLVCACNFKTGRVVSFKNECDLRKHNCRFDTDFRVILNDVCPWQYESRHDSSVFDYSNPSYYN